MKKKFSSIVLSLFILFACVFASACGDKYENMELKIYYAYAAEELEWIDGSNGILLNYLTEQDKIDLTAKGVEIDESKFLSFDNGVASVYLKVDVANVKSKHIDKIVVNAVQSAGFDLRSVTVGAGNIVEVKVSGNVNSNISLTETNSRKTKNVKFDVYRVLTGIGIDNSIKPAFKIGNSVNLKQIQNLIYQPVNQTNQTGVEYSISAIGRYESGAFQSGSRSDSIIASINDYFEITNGVLNFVGTDSSWMDSNHYIIRVKATSIHNSQIFNEFDVYIEKPDNNNNIPEVKFTSNGLSVENKIVLANNATPTYASTEVEVDISLTAGVYLGEGVSTIDGTAKYVAEIYVDGKYYDLEEDVAGINGLIISKTESLEKYTISLGENIGNNKSTLTFRYVVKGLNFDYSTSDVYKNCYEKEIIIEKNLLPSKIRINGDEVVAGVNDNNVVYSVSDSNLAYKGLELTLSAYPTNSSENIKFIIEGDGAVLGDNVVIRDSNETPVTVEGRNSTKEIANNSKIYIKFRQGSENSQKIIIKTRSNPTWFNGVNGLTATYTSITYNLTKSVTADTLELYVDEDCTTQAFKTSTVANETNLVFDANRTSYLYAKVTYRGILDKSSIKFTTEDGSVKFLNVATDEFDEITLDGFSPIDLVPVYDVFKIPVKATQVDKVTTINAVAGNGFVGTSTSAAAISRNVLTDIDVAALDVVANNNNVYVNNDLNDYFSVARGSFGEFAIVNTAKNDSVGIYDVYPSVVDGVYTSTQRTSKYTFSFVGNSNASEVKQVKANITYYKKDGGFIKKSTMEKSIYIAVYNAIGYFSTSALSNNHLVFVNDYFEDAKTTKFTFNALSSDYATPTSSITGFPGGVPINNVNSVKITVSELVRGLIDDGSVQILYNGVPINNAFLNNIFGEITIKLLKPVNVDEIGVTLNAYRFEDATATLVKNIVVPVAVHESASRIIVEGEDIVTYSETVRELQLSFIDIVGQTGSDSKTFNASLEYENAIPQANVIRYNKVNNSNMTYIVYEYSTDENGNRRKDSNNEYILNLTYKLEVNFNNGKVEVKASKEQGGGLFKLVIATKESYTTDSDYPYGFENVFELDVRVSDGSLKNKFILYSEEDVANIKNNLGKNFILGRNITYTGKPIGDNGDGTINSFVGCLSGKLEINGGFNYYTLTVNISEENLGVSTTYGCVYGLFASIGENGKVENLNLNINFIDDEINYSNTDGLNIAGLTAINKGTISNVNVIASANLKITSISDNINFGLLAAQNNGEIFLGTSTIACKKDSFALTTGSAKSYNIGLVAGTNTGIIAGGYEGKQSLSVIKFNIISSFTISAGVTNSNVNIGLVAGESTNTGNVKNILVTGYLKENNINDFSVGYFGGLVGYSTGTIETVAALGLDLYNFKNVYVGGIVGGSVGNITNAKFVSAKTKTVEAGETIGKINALVGGTVAGIVAKLSGGTISECSVENFVDKGYDNQVFYALCGTDVYGLAAGSGSIEKSFVNTRIQASGTGYTIGNLNSYSNTYFIGTINGATNYYDNSTYYVNFELNADGELIGCTANGSTLNLNYYIVDGNLEVTDWLVKIKSLVVPTVTNWETDANWRINNTFNTIKYKEVVFYFPYLIGASGSPIMIERPTDIKAPLNSDYSVNGEALYIDEFSLTGRDDIVETMVVNFYNKVGITVEERNKANTRNLLAIYEKIAGIPADLNSAYEFIDGEYKLTEDAVVVADKTYYTQIQNGLIDLTILPETAQAGVQFKIVSGYNFATINNDYTITFTNKPSEKTPIVIRAYSIFNEEVECYIVLYTQMLANSLDLASTIVGKTSTNKYIGSMYTGQSEQLIKISAENFHDGNYYQNILDNSGIESYLELTCVETNADSKQYLEVNATTITNIKLKIKEDTDFTGIANTKLTFRLFLKPDYFENATLTHSTLICMVEVDLTLYESATSLLLNSDSAYEVSSNEALKLTATMLTGYVSNSNKFNHTEDVYLDGNSFKIQLDVGDFRDTIVIDFENISKSSYLNAYLNYLAEEDIIRGDKYITKLFKTPIIKTTSIYDVLNDTKCIGYEYEITLELLDEFDIRSLGYNLGLKDENNKLFTNFNLDFKVEILAKSDNFISDSTEVTFKPTNVSTARIENYVVTSITAANTYQNIITNENVETALIDPNGKGNVMVIYVEPKYAYLNEITLTSSTAVIPVLGNKTVGLTFTQLIFNEESRSYETLIDANIQTDYSLKLKPVSRKTTEGNVFDGVIYVYMQLEKFGGKEVDFTATLNISTGSNEEIEVVKHLTTSYLPDVYLSYMGTKIQDNGATVNLVQKNTYENSVKVELYGYQFNSNPTYKFEWNLTADSDYRYVEKSTSRIAHKDDVYEDNGEYKLIDAGRKVYLIGNYAQGYLNKDYSEVEYNESTESYILYLYFYVTEAVAPIKLNVELSLTDKNGLNVFADDSLILYPTDYILKEVFVSNINNDRKNLVIGTSTALEIGFTTESNLTDHSNEIYTKLMEIYASDYSKLANLFYYYENGNKVYLSDEKDFHEAFDVNVIKDSDDNRIVTLYGKASFINKMYLDVKYYYEFEKDTFKVKFTTSDSNELRYSFDLSVISATTDENAFPIYDASDMFDENGNCILAENSFNILMNDLVLENIKPIDVKIASLDGNNKIITVKNFIVDKDRTNYGLFENLDSYVDPDGVSHKSILKNVVVDYSQFNEAGLQFTNNQIKEVVFGGLVANNNGLIYNCDVINKNVLSTAKIEMIFDDDANVVFGGLVGINSGIITNSRVGRETFKKITADSKIESVTTINFNKLEFIIGNTTVNASNNFKIVSGAFVGENAGEISSSYVKQTSLYNYSTNETVNKTAGFAGENLNGKIYFSYVEGANKDGNSPYAKNSLITNVGNGIVAGFVYTNSGTITNSYVNINLQTKSAYISGFVYENKTSAVISESYSAATMNSGAVDKGYGYAEQPFVGANSAGTLLSDGKLQNTYYLESSNYNVKEEEGKDKATPLSLDNFKDADNLNGFIFILSNSKEERELGVWSFYDINNKEQRLPTLICADTISHSYRYIVKTENTGNGAVNSYSNAKSFELGKKNNPYTISSVEQFNDAFDVYDAQYVRLINNIDFASDETAIGTRDNSIGTSGFGNVRSIEGNGLSISGIYFDATGFNVEKIGVFAEIKNTYVKNINLNFATPETDNQFSTTSVNYSGGLAGVITDSVVINVKLNGNSTTLAGNNFVGGLAGLIKGKSLIYGVDSNLSVKVGSAETDLYYTESYYRNNANPGASLEAYNNYLKKLSYAGGLAGVIDIENRSNMISNSEFNISYINIHGDEMFNKINNGITEANILSSYSGGIAGYAGENTNALKLKYHTGKKELIRGDVVAGGLFGVFLGSMEASQVTAIEDTQIKYDKVLGEYILNLDDANTKFVNDDEKVGNLNLIESYGSAGGLVGVGIGASIHASYAKVGFKAGKTIGGVIGTSVASDITYSYAVPYINLENTLKTNTDIKIGGLIGSAYRVDTTNPDAREVLVSNYINVLLASNIELNNNSYKNTDIQFTFSTIIANKTEIKNAIDSNANIGSILKMDYICPDYGSDITLTSSGGSAKLMYVYAGIVSDYEDVLIDTSNLITNLNETRALKTELRKLYDLESSDQIIEFNNIFSGWSVVPYYSLDNTKFFPLLTNDEAVNYIEIREESDFDKLRANPDANFKIVKNYLVVSPKDNDDNWIFDVNFTGILIGEIKGSEKAPVVYISSLKPSTSDTTAGMFRQTTNAKISNVTFVWLNAIDLTGVSNLTTVAGLSCLDENSTFSGVHVYVDGAGSNYLVNNTTTTLTGFGGLLGDSTNSSLLDCKFVGSVKAKFDAGSSDIHFGGLVAKAKTYFGGQSENVNTMAVMDNVLGADGVEKIPQESNNGAVMAVSKFELMLGSYFNAYVGLIVGDADNVAIANNQIGCANYANTYKNIELKISYSNGNTYVGGLAGKAIDSATSNNNVLMNCSLENGTGSTVLYVGGLYGLFNISGIVANSGISASNAVLDLDLKGLAHTTYLSAGVAKTETEVNINQCLLVGKIKRDASFTTLANYVGGAVAYVGDNLNLQEVMANINMEIGSVNTTSLFAGGLIGYIQEGKVVKINVSAAAGKLVPSCSENATNIIIGGMVGEIKEHVTLEINNSYTAISIVSSGIVKDSVRYAKISALIGNINNNTTVTVNHVVYSTDIALTPGNKHYGLNVAADAFWFSRLWHSELMSGSMLWSELPSFVAGTEARIPYIKSLKKAMETYGILSTTTPIDYTEGSVFNPVKIYAATNFNDENIDNEDKYFLLMGVVNLSGTLDGILVGAETGFEDIVKVPEISKTGAVSNIHINLEGEVVLPGGIGLVATTNNGVVYNCSVQGVGLTLNGAGDSVGLIVASNNGVVSYCYSTAEIISTNTQVLGGIVCTNSGVLSNNYFTGYINNESTIAAGIFVNVDDSANAFAYNNYMAGVITNIAENGSNFTTEETFNGFNNYLDELSNMAKIEISDGEVVLKSISTADIMAASTLEGKENWYVSVLPKLDGEDYAKDNGKIIYYLDLKTASYGYNYNYPIFNFNKKVVNATGTDLEFNDFKHQLFTGYGCSATELNNYIGENITIHESYSFEDRMNPENESYLFKDVDVTDINNYYYAFKIPHLGVLSSVQSLLSYSLNYVLMYDIDYREYSNYIPIGSSQYINQFDNAGSGFNGVFVGNKNYSYTDIAGSGAKCVIDNCNKNGLFTNVYDAYIGYLILGNATDLEESGIIAKDVIDTTIIDAVEFKDEEILIKAASKNTYYGALIGKIDGDVYINNLKTPESEGLDKLYLEGSGSTTAGLIAGKLVGGSLTIGESNLYVTFEENGIVGAIVGLMENGQITFAGNKTVFVKFANHTYAGGVVGVMQDGQIYGGTVDPAAADPAGASSTTKIDFKVTENKTITHFGGVVGMFGTLEVAPAAANIVRPYGAAEPEPVINYDISNFVVSFGNDQIYVNNFGGLVAVAKSDLMVNSIEVTKSHDGDTTTIIGNEAEDRYFGLLAGWLKDGSTLIVDSFKLNEEMNDNDEKPSILVTAEVDAKYGEELKDQGVGVLVGSQNGDLVVKLKDKLEIFLKAEHIVNLGGVSGYYGSKTGGESGDGGKLVIEDAENNYKVKLQGTSNVGGLFGYCNGNIYTEETIVGEGDDAVTHESTFVYSTGVEGEERIDTLVNISGGAEPAVAAAAGGAGGENNGFATIVVDSTRIDINSENKPSNYGGLFGVLKANEISGLTNENVFEPLKGKKNTNGTSEAADFTYYAYNIGGIAGKFIGEKAINLTNEADMDTTTISNKDEITTLFNNGADGYYVRTVNVGGIFGYVSYVAPEAVDPEVPAVAAVNGATVMEVSNCIVKSKIISGYQNVGGIVGLADGAISIIGSIELEEDKKLYVEDTNNDANEEEYTITSNGVSLGDANIESSVIGVISVGGAVGMAKNGATISQIYSKASVFGNASVGGVVGTLYSPGGEDPKVSTVSNNYVEKKDDEQTLVKGIYYNYISTDDPNIKTEERTSVFIPTSVGGVVGTVESSSISYNVLNGVTICSSNEGYTKDEDGEIIQEGTSISLIENNMVNINFSNKGLDTGDKNLTAYNINQQSKVKFDEIFSGFGGIAGSIDSATMAKYEDNYNIKTNSLSNIEIAAQLGVNVGTYFGYYYLSEEHIDESGAVQSLQLPNLNADSEKTIKDGEGNIVKDGDGNDIKNVISVNGSYNIGGIVGYFNGKPKGTNTDTILGKAYVVLQHDAVGINVGGLFGKVTSNEVESLTNNGGKDVKFIIDTESSYYLGGLIGQLYFTGSNNYLTGGSVIDQVTLSGIKDKKSSSNFGGLVGMVKSIDASGGTNITVQGTHNYAFTVNTILNAGYSDGSTQTNAKLSADGTNVTLVAQAYYVNKDNFNISATSDSSWYNADAKNPVNKQTKGWAKDYTGFKTVSRLVRNGGGNWDAYIPVYDAANITAVGTGLNTGKTGLEYSKEICDGSWSTVDANISENQIIYTVYQNEMGEAYLYCPIGIAKLAIFRDYVNNKQELLTDGKIDKYESLKAIENIDYAGTHNGPLDEDSKLVDDNKNFLKWDAFGQGEEQDYPAGKSEDVIDDPAQIMYFNWDEADTIGQFSYAKDADHNVEFYALKHAYYYKMRYNYEGSEKDAYFDFQVIYANNTLSGAGDKLSGFTYGNCPQVPSSGSVFEISGFNPTMKSGVKTISGTEDTLSLWETIWLILGAIIVVAAVVVVFVYTGGAAAPAILSIGTKFAITSSMVWAATAAVAFGGLYYISQSDILADRYETTTNTEKYLAEVYFSTNDQNLGLMSSGHTTDIYYKNGVLSSDNEIGSSVVGDNGELYYYYSSVRPVDFYSNYWYVSPTLDCNDKDAYGENYVKKIMTDKTSITTIDQTKIQVVDGKKYYDFDEDGVANEYSLIEKYFFKNGAYYYYPLASNTGWMETQELVSKSIDQIDEGLRITVDGKYYINGKYNPGIYLPPEDSNLTYDATGKKYTLNGYEISSDKIGKIKQTQNQSYKFNDSYDTTGKVEGYDYLKTIYYAATGGTNVEDMPKRYGKFKKESNVSGLRSGVDYISVTEYVPDSEGDFYEYGGYKYPITGKIIEEEGVFYVRHDQDTNLLLTGLPRYDKITVNYILESVGEGEAPASGGDTIYKQLNPYAAEDPYKGAVKCMVTLLDDKALEKVESGGQIQINIPYFLYEGGYITDYTLRGNSGAPAKIVYTFVCDSDKKYDGVKISDQVIPLWDSTGNAVNDKTILNIYNDECNDYYVMDTSEFVAHIGKLNDYKVGSIYKKHNNNLYKLDSSYFIGGSEIRDTYPDTENGLVYKLYSYIDDKDELSFTYNKYLTNSDWKVYTMHKFEDKNFNGEAFTDSDGNIYYLIPNGVNDTADIEKYNGRPNVYTTYFAESCKVTLGGGLTLTHTGKGDIPSGKITIS